MPTHEPADPGATERDPDLGIPTVAPGDGPPADPYATRLPDPSDDADGPHGSPTGPDGGGRFRRVRPHAKGGLGEVFVARDSELNRDVALKEIQDRHADHPESRARFLVEAEITGGLEHPGIVPVYGLGAYPDGRPYYAMRFVRGESLQEAIDRYHRAGGAARDPDERDLELRGLLRRFVDVCNTIAYAHSREVIHRDIKPSNVMLGPFGETLVVDWGLARSMPRDEAPGDGPEGGEVAAIEGRRPRGDDGAGAGPGARPLVPSSTGTDTMAGSAMGTPAFMSPEQARGDLDRLGPASDVYSLGATLYALLTGRAPFDGRDVDALLARVVRGEFAPPRQVDRRASAALEAICLKAMATRPDDRYPSARALADDLERWLADGAVLAYREPWSRRLARWARRHRAWAQAGASSLVLVAIVGASAALVVERARGREHAERVRAEEQTRRARRLSADLLQQRGQALAEQGDPARGLLWLARALEAAPPEDAALSGSLRTSLAGWAARVRPLRSVVAREGPAAFAPDGRAFLMGGPTSARLRDVATGRPIGPDCPHPGPVTALAFRPDGSAALIGGKDGTARLWDVADGRPIGPTLPQPGPVVAVAIGPDGRSVLVAVDVDAASGPRHEVRLWDAEGGRPLGPTLAHQGPAATLALRPDGRAALVVGPDRVPRVRDAATGEPIGEPIPPQGDLRIAAFRPDGRAVLLTRAAGRGEEARLWDPGTGRPLGPAFAHKDALLGLAFRPDGRALLVRGVEGGARLCEADTGRPLGEPLAHPNLVLVAAFSPDGRLVLTGGNDGTARLWDAQTGAPLAPPRSHRGPVVAVAFSPDGRTALSAGVDLLLWDAVPPESTGVRVPCPSPLGITSLAYRPDGRAFATGGLDGVARLLDSSTLRPIGKPMDPVDMVAALGPAPGTGGPGGPRPALLLTSAVAFGGGGRTLLTAINDLAGGRGAVQLREVAEGRPVGTARAYPDLVWAAALSPDGRTIAAGGRDRAVHLWPVEVGPTEGRVLAHPSGVDSLAISPDGFSILTGCSDRMARLWDLATGRPIGPTFAHRGAVRAVAFAPGGRSIATGGGDALARLWDLASGRPIGPPMPHADRVNALAFSPDGRTLLTGSLDRTARLWDAATGRPVGPPMAHQGEVRSVAFRPDGRAVLTDDAGVARAWDLPAPWEGAAERIRLGATCMTGLELDESGDFAALAADDWERHRRGLEELGGPP